jgi:signal transduction histidine kinase
VLGLVEVAKLESTVTGKDECLGLIKASIKKLDGFITDIIDFSRNQRVELQIDKIDIEQEVNEVLNDLKYLDKYEKIKISVVSYENRHFMTDGLRLRVILKNLVSNAIAYHDMRKQDPFIKIEIKYNSDAAIINVSDNGIGIDNEHLKSIFKMFYRADETSNGSGLGLYIVKESIEKLEGKIEVQSKLKEGTTFIITIPLSKPIE